MECTEAITALRPFADLDPIRKGTNEVLCALLRINQAANDDYAKINALEQVDQETIQSQLRTCQAALVAMTEVFASYDLIRNLQFDEEPRDIIQLEIINIPGFHFDLDQLAMSLHDLHKITDMFQMSGFCALQEWYTSSIQSRLTKTRQLIDIFDSTSSFRQQLSASMRTQTRKKEQSCMTDTIPRLVPDGPSAPLTQDHEHNANSGAGATYPTIEQVFQEAKQESLLRVALREAAAGIPGHISLDKAADDALREAAIQRIAKSSTSSSSSACSAHRTGTNHGSLSNADKDRPGLHGSGTAPANTDSIVMNDSKSQNGAASIAMAESDAALQELVEFVVKTLETKVTPLDKHSSDEDLKPTSKKIVKRVLKFGDGLVKRVNEGFQEVVGTILISACEESERADQYVMLLDHMSKALTKALKIEFDGEASAASDARPWRIKKHLSHISPSLMPGLKLVSAVGTYQTSLSTEGLLGLPTVLSALHDNGLLGGELVALGWHLRNVNFGHFATSRVVAENGESNGGN